MTRSRLPLRPNPLRLYFSASASLDSVSRGASSNPHPHHAGPAPAGPATAIADAQTLAADGKMGAEFRELIRHAREMQNLMVKHLDGGTEYARGLADSIGTRPDELEAALKRDLN